MKHLHQTLVGVHTDHSQEALWDPCTKDFHEAILARDSRTVFTWVAHKSHPHETFTTEVCTKCPHERLEAPFRWEEPVTEVESHEKPKNREGRVRRLKR
jgi:hypothetical protein